MDAGGDHGSAAKGLAIDLEVVGSGPVSCRFSFPSLSLPRVYSSLACFSFNFPFDDATLVITEPK